MDADTAEFLKTHFLVCAGRGLVFSSHVVSLNGRLAEFMDSESNREIRSYKLPSIVSLSATRQHLDAGRLTPQEVIYLGKIPALIYTSLKYPLPETRRTEIVRTWIDASIGPADVKKLLSSMLSGNVLAVPGCLLELMDVDSAPDGKNYVRWVPYHMQYVTNQLANNLGLNSEFRQCLSALTYSFVTFRSAKWESGDAWEALFLIVLLCRCLCGELACELLPIYGYSPDETRVRYNSPYRGDTFLSKDLGEFISGIPVAGGPALPAISVYYPGHSNFEVYDVILAAWDHVGTRTMYGYQCKEGRSIPAAFANENMFAKSFLIRGDAVTNDNSVRRWFTPSESHLDTFFGVSSSQWSPKAWKALASGQQENGIANSTSATTVGADKLI
jgi:hypothetical protein